MTGTAREVALEVIEASVTALEDEFIPGFEDMLQDCQPHIRATTADLMRRVLLLLDDIKADLADYEYEEE